MRSAELRFDDHVDRQLVVDVQNPDRRRDDMALECEHCHRGFDGSRRTHAVPERTMMRACALGSWLIACTTPRPWPSRR